MRPRSTGGCSPRTGSGISRKDPAIRSNTSVCLQFADRSDEEANRARQKAIVKLLEAEDAAYDIGAYRDAPPGLRIWCGATIDTADIEALGPWLDWAWEQTTMTDHVRVLIADKMDPRGRRDLPRARHRRRREARPDARRARRDHRRLRRPRRAQLDPGQRRRDGRRPAPPQSHRPRRDRRRHDRRAGRLARAESSS